MSGAIVAHVARRLLVARNPNPFGPSAWATVGYALFFWASVTWFAWRAPDWMLCYFLPADSVPMIGVHLLFGVCLVLAALSGHTLTAVLLQRGQRGASFVVLAGGLVAWGGLWGLTLDRYMAVGTHTDWVQGTTTMITASSMTGALNLVGALQVLVAGTLLVLLARAGRRLRAL